MKRWELSILIGLVLAIFTSSITGFAQQCSTVRSSTVRLHILANSDSEEDQALKLQVRDAVLGAVEDTLAVAETREAALQLARESLPEVERTARGVLQSAGNTDAVRAEVVNMYFATRRYENGVVMPAGRYDAVRIIIGQGAGHNWWCVMFPPLCLPAAEGESPPEDESAAQRLGERVLLHEKPEYEVKFAVVEAYERVKEYFAGGKPAVAS